MQHGVGSAHLLDGRIPHVLLLELFSDAGVGTMITTTGDATSRRPAHDVDHARDRHAYASPLMPTYPPAPVTFVRGEGS